MYYLYSNTSLIVEVPWTFKRAEEEIALTQEEQNTLLNEVEDSWYKEMFYFMCLTGVRVGELGGLKWSDIDFEKKVVNIQRSLSCSYSNGIKREMLVSPKTVNSTRQIPFIGEMEDILKSQKQKQIQLKKELGNRWRSKDEFSDLVFTTGMGSPCSRYIVQKEIKKNSSTYTGKGSSGISTRRKKTQSDPRFSSTYTSTYICYQMF